MICCTGSPVAMCAATLSLAPGLKETWPLTAKASLAADELARRLIEQLSGAQLVQFLSRSVSPSTLVERLQQAQSAQ